MWKEVCKIEACWQLLLCSAFYTELLRSLVTFPHHFKQHVRCDTEWTHARFSYNRGHLRCYICQGTLIRASDGQTGSVKSFLLQWFFVDLMLLKTVIHACFLHPFIWLVQWLLLLSFHIHKRVFKTGLLYLKVSCTGEQYPCNWLE